MTYKQLLKKLQAMSEERLKDTVTVFDPYIIEYIPVEDLCINEGDSATDVLDEGHAYLVLNE